MKENTGDSCAASKFFQHCEVEVINSPLIASIGLLLGHDTSVQL